MGTLDKTARVAGLLYLFFVCCGIFYLRFVPSKILVPGNIAETIRHIRSYETLYRLGILAEILSNIIFFGLAMTLYRLLSAVNKIQAVMMLTFVAFGIVISLISLQNKLAVLSLLSNADYLKTFTPQYFNTQVLLNLSLYRNGIITGEIFWGLWLFPLGYLVFKSGFLPKALGILLMIGCFGYLGDYAGSFFFARYNETAISNYITLPASLGELCICLWLLIRGAKDK